METQVFLSKVYKRYRIHGINNFHKKAQETLDLILLEETVDPIFSYLKLSLNLARKLKRSTSRTQVKKFLNKQTIYARTRKPKKQSEFAWTTVKDRYIKWQMDLIDVRKMNLQFSYVLTIIDTFSKYAFVAALESKHAYPVALVLDALFAHEEESKGPFKPLLLLSDDGGEFRNKYVYKVCKFHKVFQIYSKSYNPLGIIERFNQTLKNRMWNTLDQPGEKNGDWLEQILWDYNESKHSTTQFKPFVIHFEQDPARIIKIINHVQLRLRLIREKGKPKNTEPLYPGERVRVIVWHDPRLTPFERNKVKKKFTYKPQREFWTAQQFIVQEKRGINYILEHFPNARFKRSHLQKVL